MKILAVDDKKLTLEALEDAIKKSRTVGRALLLQKRKRGSGF